MGRVHPRVGTGPDLPYSVGRVRSGPIVYVGHPG